MEGLLGVVFCDIDNFKGINDSYGHDVGDWLLIWAARTINNHVRDVDMVVRYGGDEFVVVLPRADQEQARMVAERIREAAASKLHKVGATEESLQVSLSIGVATMSLQQTFPGPKELIRAADQALYPAKASGRNKVAVYSPDGDPEKNPTALQKPERRAG